MDYNSTGLLGRFVADPVLSETPSGISVITFRLANERGFGENKRTNFINCVAWRNTAETIAKYFEKGKQILVGGELQTRTYEDKQGNKRVVTEILVNEFSFCDSKPNGEGNSQSKEENGYKPKQMSLTEVEDSSDLPF